ncbi:hypothetical protein WMY93_015555 [Mugilogobius chulae]|uniref:CCHC-type domain-containing protein n=1 Tax=Mugilogobius chulae TaxID=88201 RepID=A0AAW0NWW5_9GOBI
MHAQHRAEQPQERSRIKKIDPDIEFTIKLLSSECAATATAERAPPHDYLQDLRRLSQQSGRPFEEVLKGAMDQLSDYLGLAATGGEDEEEEVEDDYTEDYKGEDEENTADAAVTIRGKQPILFLPSPLGGRPFTAQPGPSSQSQPQPDPAVRPRISLSGHDLNPPEIQRVVVEHIVRKDDFTAQSLSPLRLRTFSGKSPKPAHEADYDSWKTQIELLNADPSLAPMHITRRIIESLLPPAADLVKSLGPNALPVTFLRVLDSAYATVEDGEELFSKFLNTFQNHGERPSSYLQRLQLTLTTVVQRGGIAATDKDKHLLKQFCRGCWDNAVINKLQLEQKKDQPPSFADLLFTLRTEEDRQSAKETLMKKHIPSVKHRVNIQSQSTSACSCGHSPDMSAIEDLKRQMLKLQSQMSTLLSKNSLGSAKPQTKQKSQQAVNRPKPWFCFKCGQDGHIAPHCTNEPNPNLVEEKRKQLKSKQQVWENKRTLN